MNSKVKKFIAFMSEELRSFIYLLWIGVSALVGGALIAVIPISAILIGFYNL